MSLNKRFDILKIRVRLYNRLNSEILLNKQINREILMSEKRDAFVQKLKAKIDEWNAEIDRLSARADQAEVEARAEYHDEIQTLKLYLNYPEHKLKEIQDAGQEAWEDLKSGAEMAFDAMSEVISSARKRIE